MPMLSPESIHALQMALQNELDTSQIYTYALPQVKNGKMREILKNLIAEEWEHEKKIKYSLKEGGGEIPDLEPEPEMPSREMRMDAELKNLSIAELIDLALENEKISRDFYHAQFGRVDDEKVKAVFKWLKEEEERHIEELQSEYQKHIKS